MSKASDIDRREIARLEELRAVRQAKLDDADRKLTEARLRAKGRGS